MRINVILDLPTFTEDGSPVFWILGRLIPNPRLGLTNFFPRIIRVSVFVHYDGAVSTDPDQVNQFVLTTFREREMAEYFATVVDEGKIAPFNKGRLLVRSKVPKPQFQIDTIRGAFHPQYAIGLQETATANTK